MRKLSVPIGTAAVLVALAGAAYSQRVAAPPPPTPPTSISVSTCVGNVQRVQTCNSDGRACVPAFNVPCNPYGCNRDGRVCNTSCMSSADCSGDGACDSVRDQCAIATSTCRDSTDLLTSDGQIVSCAPYSCRAGTCRESCENNNGCTDDHRCSSGRCIPR